MHRKTITQFADSVADFSSQYGSEDSMSYSVWNLTGKPSVSSYEDSPWSFVMRTFGPWWEKSPSASRPFKGQSHHRYPSQDFVEVTFEQKVYPIKLDIYENYNPGSVVKIMAFSSMTFRWTTLWQAEQLETNLPAKSRVFSPPLKEVGFLTDLIRLEFHHQHLRYYAQLNAVRLTGSRETAASPLSSALLLYQPPRHHLNEFSGLNLVCGRLQSLSFLVQPVRFPASMVGVTNRRSSFIDGSKTNHFESLSSEVIHLIVSYLDLFSLCRLACTSRLMQKQCYDPLLYSELDLQPYWHKVIENTLSGLKCRCKSLQKLRLSWCGNCGRLSSTSVVNFVSACGRHLSCIQLSNCKFLDNDFLATLAQSAPQLEDLDLQNCQQPAFDMRSFQQIAKFSYLRRLNLYRTLIELWPLLNILRCCPKLECLNLGSCAAVSNFDEVALEISHSCRSLRSLNLWRAKSLTAVGVKSIAHSCQVLEELDLGWCVEVFSNSGCFLNLAEKCPRLRRLCLTSLRTICDNDVTALALCCPRLQQLDILGTREVGPASCERLLATCQNLRYLDVSYCEQIDFLTVQLWRQTYSKVYIAQSDQSHF